MHLGLRERLFGTSRKSTLRQSGLKEVWGKDGEVTSLKGKWRGKAWAEKTLILRCWFDTSERKARSFRPKCRCDQVSANPRGSSRTKIAPEGSPTLGRKGQVPVTHPAHSHGGDCPSSMRSLCPHLQSWGASWRWYSWRLPAKPTVCSWATVFFLEGRSERHTWMAAKESSHNIHTLNIFY